MGLRIGGGVTTFLVVTGGLALAGSRLVAVESDTEADIDAIFADLDSRSQISFFTARRALASLGGKSVRVSRSDSTRFGSH